MSAPLTPEQWATVWENRALAYKVARSFAGRGVPMEDLEQEALLGLASAVAAHDPARGSLGTLAFTACRRACSTAVDAMGRPVSYPDSSSLYRARVLGARDSLRQSLGREPSEKEVVEAAKPHLPARRANETHILHLLRHDVREVRLSETDPLGRVRELPDASEGPERATEAAERLRLLEEALATLPERDAGILRLLCGLTEDGEALDGAAVARLRGISRQRIQQVRDRALRALRSGSHAGTLRELWDEVEP